MCRDRRPKTGDRASGAVVRRWPSARVVAGAGYSVEFPVVPTSSACPATPSLPIPSYLARPQDFPYALNRDVVPPGMCPACEIDSLLGRPVAAGPGRAVRSWGWRQLLG